MSERLSLELQAALAELALAVFTSHVLTESLDRLLGLACRLIPACASGSIAMLVDGQPTTTAVTDHVAFELDVVQYEAADGPCLTALGGRTVRFGILDETERFPHFAIGAADRRIRSVLSTPIRHGGGIIGTLNLYSRELTALTTRRSESPTSPPLRPARRSSRPGSTNRPGSDVTSCSLPMTKRPRSAKPRAR